MKYALVHIRSRTTPHASNDTSSGACEKMLLAVEARPMIIRRTTYNDICTRTNTRTVQARLPLSFAVINQCHKHNPKIIQSARIMPVPVSESVYRDAGAADVEDVTALTLTALSTHLHPFALASRRVALGTILCSSSS